MERESRSAPLQFRSEMLTKVRSYREAIGKIQSDIRKKEIELKKDKKYFQGDDEQDDEQDHEASLRQQVMRGTAVLEKTSERIQRSTQIAYETEEIGADIMTDLSVQR